MIIYLNVNEAGYEEYRNKEVICLVLVTLKGNGTPDVVIETQLQFLTSAELVYMSDFWTLLLQNCRV